ncbi:MAG: integration host factor subunit beta [Deltaproteobacteria bacterium]|nr:MAG: integration host factor subunit beta [Deltaproteobacteria bacterium]
MTKRDLIDEILTRYPRLSGGEAEVVVNLVLDSMADALAHGRRIEIRGFGSFVVRRRPAREGRNPRTGAPVALPERWVPFFKPGKELKLRVSGKPVPNSAGDASDG